MNLLQFNAFRKTQNFDSINYEFGVNSEKNLLEKLSNYFASDIEHLPCGTYVHLSVRFAP